jgi:hypothetical protein
MAYTLKVGSQHHTVRVTGAFGSSGAVFCWLPPANAIIPVKSITGTNKNNLFIFVPPNIKFIIVYFAF